MAVCKRATLSGLLSCCASACGLWQAAELLLLYTPYAGSVAVAPCTAYAYVHDMNYLGLV